MQLLVTSPSLSRIYLAVADDLAVAHSIVVAEIVAPLIDHVLMLHLSSSRSPHHPRRNLVVYILAYYS
jgi:hypothetical protein